MESCLHLSYNSFPDVEMYRSHTLFRYANGDSMVTNYFPNLLANTAVGVNKGDLVFYSPYYDILTETDCVMTVLKGCTSPGHVWFDRNGIQVVQTRPVVHVWTDSEMAILAVRPRLPPRAFCPLSEEAGRLHGPAAWWNVRPRTFFDPLPSVSVRQGVELNQSANIYALYVVSRVLDDWTWVDIDEGIRLTVGDSDYNVQYRLLDDRPFFYRDAEDTAPLGVCCAPTDWEVPGHDYWRQFPRTVALPTPLWWKTVRDVAVRRSHGPRIARFMIAHADEMLSSMYHPDHVFDNTRVGKELLERNEDWF